MLAYKKFGAVAATAAAALLATAGSAAAHEVSHNFGNWERSGAVFVQTNNPAGNAIAVYDRSFGGTLTAAGTYATGGVGGQLAGSQVDRLASQNSLVYDAQAGELFAVNAGSNTVSVFDVDGDRLRLRQVVPSGGTFPASITVHGDLVYVLNSTGAGEIQGFRLVGDGNLQPIAGSGRSLGLNPTATPQFVSTAGDIAFSPDGDQLLVTTKANTNAIDVFGVDRFGLPSATPVVNSEPGDVPFALAFEGGNQVDVGEAGPNAVASFELHGNGTLTALSSVGTGGAATCWLVADGPELFAGNAGSATESSVFSSWSGGLSLTATTGTDSGTVDAAVSPLGRYLYVETGLNGIVDEFAVGFNGSLTELGSVTVPNAAGGEGIATS
jgi:6-phosphogluconolactonase (cycloisomerase 2 family)